MKKRILSLLLPLCFLVVSAVSADIPARKIQTVFEGEVKKAIKLYSFSSDDYFSAKDVAHVYGADIVYHPITGKIALTMNNRRLDIYIKSTRIVLNGKKKRISLPTRYVGGELYIPATFILSQDFAGFSETHSLFNGDNAILTVERAVNVNPPRFYTKSKTTQVIIELNEDLSYTLTQKKNVVSIAFVRGSVNDDSISVDDGTVKTITAKNSGRQAVVTITLDVAADAVQKKYLTKPNRLMLDITRKPGAETPKVAVVESSSDTVSGLDTALSTAAVEAVVESTAVAAAALEEKASAPVDDAGKKIRLILDAGHGGDDPGAVGPNGTKEKEINLAIVQELKQLFDEDGRYEVILSRSDDTFIPLVERTSLANDKKVDLFVSVHCNANMDRSTGGFEIYFLNEKASDADAAATAILENSVVRLEGQPSKKRARLQELLWSLAVNEFINESAELCSFITGEVTRRVKIENRGVKQAGFFVLRGTQMPAVLVECAFLSNYGEEAKLRTKKFQRYIADAIYEGVKKYEVRREMLNAKK